MIFWLIILAITLFAEVLTCALTSIWFSAGALFAFFAALAGAGKLFQIFSFFVVSIVLLIFTRPIAKKHFKVTPTNALSLIGETAVVTEEINNIAETGKVKVNGMEWSARTKEDNVVIRRDIRVLILDIKGVKLIVEEKQQTSSQQDSQVNR